MPKLVVYCGLGALQDDYIAELLKHINAIHLNKNTLTDNLLGGKDHTTPEYQAVKPNMYAALNHLALDQLENGNNVILHGYYGNKLTQPGTVELFTPAPNTYEVKIIYLHCSGERHQKIIADRGSKRDDDKKGDKYNPYRLEHIHDHLREIAQVSDVLLVDIENNTLDKNMQIILNHIRSTANPIKITPLNTDAEKILAALTIEEALGGIETFKNILNKLRCNAVDELKIQSEEEQTVNLTGSASRNQSLPQFEATKKTLLNAEEPILCESFNKVYKIPAKNSSAS
jgi:hypothetical protein